jgi:hypothetical protein
VQINSKPANRESTNHLFKFLLSLPPFSSLPHEWLAGSSVAGWRYELSSREIPLRRKEEISALVLVSRVVPWHVFFILFLSYAAAAEKYENAKVRYYAVRGAECGEAQEI